MVNHFRTLLLNLPYVGNTWEHIPSFFRGIPLPKALSDFHNLIYPSDATREYKLFLAFTYLRIIQAAGKNEAFSLKDPRITYDMADDGSLFLFNRTSNPQARDSVFKMTVTGNYVFPADYHAKSEIRITVYEQEVGGSLTVLISNESDTLYTHSMAPLVYTNYVSAPITLTGTNLTIQITNTGQDEQEYPNAWTLLCQGPYVFNFTGLMASLKDNAMLVEAMLDYRRDLGIDTYENLWKSHPNSVYRLAGLLISYVLRIEPAAMRKTAYGLYQRTTTTTTTTTCNGPCEPPCHDQRTQVCEVV